MNGIPRGRYRPTRATNTLSSARLATARRWEKKRPPCRNWDDLNARTFSGP
jgi:hypothetical protein